MVEEGIVMVLKGAVAGFLIAAPVGPVALICLKRTLTGHTFLALSAGFGAAFADAFLAGIACLGLQAAGELLKNYDVMLRLGGGMFVLILGFISLGQKPSPQRRIQSSLNFLSSFLIAFFLTICNPLTIVAFAATFSALGINHTQEYYDSLNFIFLVSGVLAGAATWWTFLVGLSRMAKNRFGFEDVWRIHQASGIIFILFGVSILATVIFGFYRP